MNKRFYNDSISIDEHSKEVKVYTDYENLRHRPSLDDYDMECTSRKDIYEWERYLQSFK